MSTTPFNTHWRAEKSTSSFWNITFGDQRRIHVEHPVLLLQFGGVEALQPKQIPTDHATPPPCRISGWSGAWSQTRAAA